MLSFFSIFGIQNNYINIAKQWKGLWIAFIFQYLWDTKQLYRYSGTDLLGCELLSFFSIFGIQNNPNEYGDKLEIVVNCFHFSVSLGYKTTGLILHSKKATLWIAFIFQYLWDTKQLIVNIYVRINSCELLSFFSIFGIQNNLKGFQLFRLSVVNCFHFSVSLGYKTTFKRLANNILSLWIAFIFQYLWDTKQLYWRIWALWICCELLSFFSIFGIQNN